MMMRLGPINKQMVQGPPPSYCPMYVFFSFFLLSFILLTVFLVFLMPYDRGTPKTAVGKLFLFLF